MSYLCNLDQFSSFLDVSWCFTFVYVRSTEGIECRNPRPLICFETIWINGQTVRVAKMNIKTSNNPCNILQPYTRLTFPWIVPSFGQKICGLNRGAGLRARTSVASSPWSRTLTWTWCTSRALDAFFACLADSVVLQPVGPGWSAWACQQGVACGILRTCGWWHGQKKKTQQDAILPESFGRSGPLLWDFPLWELHSVCCDIVAVFLASWFGGWADTSAGATSLWMPVRRFPIKRLAASPNDSFSRVFFNGGGDGRLPFEPDGWRGSMSRTLHDIAWHCIFGGRVDAVTPASWLIWLGETLWCPKLFG